MHNERKRGAENRNIYSYAFGRKIIFRCAAPANRQISFSCIYFAALLPFLAERLKQYIICVIGENNFTLFSSQVQSTGTFIEKCTMKEKEVQRTGIFIAKRSAEREYYGALHLKTAKFPLATYISQRCCRSLQNDSNNT
jgi:hypothetical protein